MSYGYWSTIIAVLLLLLLLLKAIPRISHRVLLIAANVALLRALLPITIPSMTSIYNWLNPRLHIEETPVIHATYAAGDASVSTLSLTIQNSTNVFQILTGIGIAFFAIVSLWAAINSCRLIKNSYVCTDAATMAWVELNKKKFYKVTVLHSERISTPISCDFVLRSFILVPPMYELRDDNTGIYTHEMMHIRHRDTIWKILALLVLCIHWFNPIVWMLVYYHRIETELACDEEVLQVFGTDYRSQYARDLIDYSSNANNGFAFTSSIVFTPFQSKQLLKMRVKNIMRFKAKTSKKLLITAGIITFVMICFATNSFASSSLRQPIIPDPVTAMATDQDVAAISSTDGPTFTEYSLSMKDGAVSEHDIKPEDMMIYDNDGKPWSLVEGQTVSLRLDIVDRDFPYGQQTEIGFIAGGEQSLIFAEQIKNGTEITLTAPETNDYYFYVKGQSSDTILVNSFTIK